MCGFTGIFVRSQVVRDFLLLWSPVYHVDCLASAFIVFTRHSLCSGYRGFPLIIHTCIESRCTVSASIDIYIYIYIYIYSGPVIYVPAYSFPYDKLVEKSVRMDDRTFAGFPAVVNNLLRTWVRICVICKEPLFLTIEASC